MNSWPPQKYASHAMGTKRRKFPFQPTEKTGDVSTDATLEPIIKERMEIQKERTRIHTHDNKRGVKVHAQETGCGWFC